VPVYRKSLFWVRYFNSYIIQWPYLGSSCAVLWLHENCLITKIVRFICGHSSNHLGAPDVLRRSNGTSGADLTHFTNTIKPLDQMRCRLTQPAPQIYTSTPVAMRQAPLALPLHSIIKDHISPATTWMRRLGLILRKAMTATLLTPMTRNWGACGCSVLATEFPDDLVARMCPEVRCKLCKITL